MIIDEMLLKDLYKEANEEKLTKAKKIVKDKKVNITKVMFDNKSNFEVSSIVEGSQVYDVFIKIANNEIENLRCTCADYEDNYCACKHIIATMMQFSENNQYVLNKNEDIKNNRVHIKTKNNYRIFKQLVNQFYYEIEEINDQSEKEKTIGEGDIRIVPKLIYSEQNKNLKLEIRIGRKNLYKIKSLPDFFDRMIKEEEFKYGANLEFKHTKEAFIKEDLKLLEFIMKYGEIIKYANESSNNYGYYARALSDSYILLSNTGMDELFEILKNKYITIQEQNEEREIFFEDEEPNIKFILQEKNEYEYILKPNIDVYAYNIFYGKDHLYFLMDDKLYKSSRKREKDVLPMLNIFSKNFTQEIDFSRDDLKTLFSIVYPTTKDYIDLENLSQTDREKYVPKDLDAKVYLDYDKNNFITADIKFVYGDQEFNPLLENDLEISRDAIKESEVLEMFRKTGFMLDEKNARLILTNDEYIYNFLTNDIE